MRAVDNTPTTRWRRRKTARPVEILSAALASFAERGFAATRLDDVAARAGVTKGTLYLYFRSKEELFKAVVRQELVPTIELAEAMIRTAGASSPVLLEQLVGLFSQIIRSSLSTSKTLRTKSLKENRNTLFLPGTVFIERTQRSFRI